MAGDAFQKFKSSINRGVTAINVKTSSSLEKAKIKTHIDSISNEVQQMMTAVGEAFYLMWNKGDTDYSKLYDHLEVVRHKKEEIARLNAECAAIDERSNQIMGASAGSNVASASEILAGNVCPSCNTPYADGARFCRKCGYKLQGE